MIVKLDDEDFGRLSHFHWCYRGERNGAQGYAIRHAKVDGNVKTVYMHREIMGDIPPKHEVIFLNYDRMDCRRENLRIVNKEEARRHHRVRKDSKTGAKGVHFDAQKIVWTAALHRGGRHIHLGTFGTGREAVEAYENALRREDADLHARHEVVYPNPSLTAD
jgi:hypothetical protein